MKCSELILKLQQTMATAGDIQVHCDAVGFVAGNVHIENTDDGRVLVVDADMPDLDGILVDA